MWRWRCEQRGWSVRSCVRACLEELSFCSQSACSALAHCTRPPSRHARTSRCRGHGRRPELARGTWPWTAWSRSRQGWSRCRRPSWSTPPCRQLQCREPPPACVQSSSRVVYCLWIWTTINWTAHHPAPAAAAAAAGKWSRWDGRGSAMTSQRWRLVLVEITCGSISSSNQHETVTSTRWQLAIAALACTAARAVPASWLY